MLAATLNVPRNDREWDRWSFDNADAVRGIQQAIQRQLSVTLPTYPIDPINWQRIDDFLENNSQVHIDFNAVLGLQSVDLQTVNLKDEKQLQSWIWANYLELNSAQLALKI